MSTHVMKTLILCSTVLFFGCGLNSDVERLDKKIGKLTDSTEKLSQDASSISESAERIPEGTDALSDSAKTIDQSLALMKDSLKAFEQLAKQLTVSFQRMTSEETMEDLKKGLKGLSQMSETISKLTSEIDGKGLSEEIKLTLTTTRKEISNVSQSIQNLEDKFSTLNPQEINANFTAIEEHLKKVGEVAEKISGLTEQFDFSTNVPEETQELIEDYNPFDHIPKAQQ